MGLLAAVGCGEDARELDEATRVADAGAEEAGGPAQPAADGGGEGGRSEAGEGGSAPAAEGGSGGMAGGGWGSHGQAGRGAGETGTGSGSGSGGGGGPGALLPELRVYSDTASIEFTPALVAAQRFYAGKATVQSGGIANLFNASRADLATNAETQALRQSAQRPNLRIICTVTETFYRIVAHRGAGIEQLADLRGKRVGTIMNTSAHYYLDKMLRTAGMTAADVTVMSIFPLSGMPQALQSGRVDAVTSWEPEPQRAADLIGADAIVFQDRAVYREIVNLHTTAETLANPEKRRGIVAFVRALRMAANQFQNEPEKAWPLVADVLGYDAALIEKVWPLERFPGTLVEDLLEVLVEEEVWVAQQSGRSPRSRGELATLIDRSVVEEAFGSR